MNLSQLMDAGCRNYGWQNAAPTPAHDYILPAVLRLLPRSERLSILDAGCGNGFLAGELARLGHQVTGVDISEDGIEIARQKYPGANFHVASLYDDLRELAGEVDVVVSSEVIEHLYSPKTFLLNMRRLLPRGGLIILTTPYHGYLKNLLISITNGWDDHHTTDWDGGHIKFFSERSLTRVLRTAGFDDVVFKNAGRFSFLWKSMVCKAVAS